MHLNQRSWPYVRAPNPLSQSWVLIMNRLYLVIRDYMIVQNGVIPWPFTKMRKSQSTIGQIPKLAIRWS